MAAPTVETPTRLLISGMAGADPLLPASLLPRTGTRAREPVRESRRLGLELRAAQGRPRLFQLFDQTLRPDRENRG